MCVKGSALKVGVRGWLFTKRRSREARHGPIKAGLKNGLFMFGCMYRRGHQESNLNLASEDTSVINTPK
jgi:hypothetical protein